MKVDVVNSGAELELVRTREMRPGSAEEKKEPRAAPPAIQAVKEDESRGMDRLAEEIQKYIKENKSVVDISLDEELKIIITRVLEEDGGKVIRQFPPEDILAVMKQLRSQRGVLLDTKG